MAAAATPLPKEDNTPPVMKMILFFHSPLLYLGKPNVKPRNEAWRQRRKEGQGRGPERKNRICVGEKKPDPGLGSEFLELGGHIGCRPGR